MPVKFNNNNNNFFHNTKPLDTPPNNIVREKGSQEDIFSVHIHETWIQPQQIYFQVKMRYGSWKQSFFIYNRPMIYTLLVWSYIQSK